MQVSRKWIKIIGVVGLCFLIFGAVSFLIFKEIQSPLVSRATLTQVIIGFLGVILYLVFSFKDFTQGFQQNQERLTGLVGIGLFFLIVLGLNIVTQVKFQDLEYDTTKNKIFSLNEQSLQVLSEIKDPVRVVSFVQDRQGKQRVGDLMRKYDKMSDQLEFAQLDADSSPKEALDLGADETQVFFINTQTEKRESVDFRSFTEQEVTNAIRRTQLVDDYVVYFLQGSGFPQINFNNVNIRNASTDELNYAPFFLKREGFKLSSIDLTKTPQIPKDATLIVAWGLKGDVPESSLQSLRAFLNEGGDMIIAQSPYQNATTAELAYSNWNALLKDYNTAFDESLSLIAVPDKPGNIRVALTPLVKAEGSPSFTQGIEGNQDYGEFFLSQGVRQLKEKDPENLRRLSFLSSLTRIATTTDLSNVQPGQVVPESQFEMKDQQSFGMQVIVDHKEDKKIDQETQLIVLGNSEFASNKYYTVPFHNNLFLNLFHTAFDTEQPVIVARKTWPRSTLNISAETKMAVIFASIFLIPELIVVFGLSFWILRRSRT